MTNIRYVKENDLKIQQKAGFSLKTQDTMLMGKVIEFYKEDINFLKLISVLNKQNNLSLRIIDYFVTNYSKENNIIYEKTGKNFIVYNNYKRQLKSYSKKQFDPFCRRERILFYINEYDGFINPPIRTTIGQLNFFRWAINNGILEYIQNNFKEIEKTMNLFSTKPTSKKNKYVTSSNLTLSTTRKVSRHNVTITIKFN